MGKGYSRSKMVVTLASMVNFATPKTKAELGRQDVSVNQNETLNKYQKWHKKLSKERSKEAIKVQRQLKIALGDLQQMEATSVNNLYKHLPKEENQRIVTYYEENR